MPPRAISILVLVQWLVIFIGIVVTGIFLKIRGIEALPYGGQLYPHVPQLVRTYGYLLLLIPIGWGTAATISVRILDASPITTRKYLVAGYVLILSLILLFVASAEMARTAGIMQMPK